MHQTIKQSSFITSTIKNKKHSTTSPLLSYYMSELVPNYEELISSNIKQLKLTEPLIEEEKDIGTQIESSIKKHHNFIIPAISLELKNPSSTPKQPQIELQLDNLKELFSLFGEITFIDITSNSNKAYILYKYYFSALFAFEAINRILSQKSPNDQITIKLVSENVIKENPQPNNPTNNRLRLNTECQAYIPKTYKNKSSIPTPTSIPIEQTKASQTPLNINRDVPATMNQLPVVNTIQFSTFSSREYWYKYVTNYNVQIENEAEFQVTKRIIGNNGFTLKKIIYDSCIAFNDYSTKVRLRGKGSGYKEGLEKKESDEALQLCVSSLNYQTYVNCCKLLEMFLERLYYDYYLFLKVKGSSNIHSNTNTTKLEIMKYEFVVNRFLNNE